MSLIKNHQGIALIQVLIISIILTMLGIYINQTVRSQINVVGQMKSAFELSLQLENSEAELLHYLLTNKHYTKPNSEVPLVQRWNFYGKPFSLSENTTVIIQDQSGLLGLNIINSTLATNVIAELGFSGHEVRTFIDSLADWKDKDDLKRLNGAESDYYRQSQLIGPRNAYLQTLEEVINIKQANMLTIEQWKTYFTEEIISNFNPLNAPEKILKAFINNERGYEEVIKLRAEKVLTGYSFYQATGIDSDEYISFSTGQILKVTIMVQEQSNKLSKSFIVDLRPNSFSRPVIISKLMWNIM